LAKAPISAQNMGVFCICPAPVRADLRQNVMLLVDTAILGLNSLVLGLFLAKIKLAGFSAE